MRRLVVLLALLLLLVPSVVWAATYTATITVTESGGNSYDELGIIALMNNSALVTGGYITSTGLDTRVLDGSVILPHMLTDSRTLFVGDVTANATSVFTYEAGLSLLSSFDIITGYGGSIAVADADAIELGNDFRITVSGYIDTSAGADKNIIYAPNAANPAYRLYVSAASTITSDIDNGTVVSSATSVVSGTYVVTVIVDGTNQRIWVDSVLKDTDAIGGASVPNITGAWTIGQSNVMPYMDYVVIWVR